MVAHYAAPVAPAVLHGLNVREKNYLDTEYVPPQRHVMMGYPWDNFIPQLCWCVAVYDDGLGYDCEGNAYWDSPPEWYNVSYHRTQRGAEIAAAYMEHNGTNPNRIMVTQGYQEQWHYDRKIED